jgi:ABC-type multidrug transport system fused ATPase/permease subunit
MKRTRIKPSADELTDPKLIKIRDEVNNQPSPFDAPGLNLKACLFHTFVQKYIKISKYMTPTNNCHFNIAKMDSIQRNMTLMKNYMAEGSSILGAFYYSNTFGIWVSYLTTLLSVCTQFSCIYLCNLILEDLRRQHEKFGKATEKWFIFQCVILLITMNTVDYVIDSWSWTYRSRLVCRAKAGVTGMIYEKMLRVGIVNPNEHDEGAIINYMESDTDMLMNAGYFGFDGVFRNAFKMVIALIFGLHFYGWTFLIVTLGIAGICYFNAKVYDVWSKYEEKWSEESDKRVNLLKTVFKNLKFIKLNTLENFFFYKIDEQRRKESKYILKCCLIYGFDSLMTPLGFNGTLCFFLFFFFKTGGILNVATATIFLRIIVQLKESVEHFPQMVSTLGSLKISLKRIEKFLRSKEVEKNKVQAAPNYGSEYGIQIKNGHFYWDKKRTKEEAEEEEEQTNKEESKNELEDNLLGNEMTELKKLKAQGLFIMTDLNFKAKKRELTTIIGQVGSGKSSLLYALLGEMRTGKDAQESVWLNGTVSYLGQTPWMLNGTVKSNILLNMPYDQRKFEEVIKLSALQEDLENWDDREMHIIGDEGTAVSGGQRARIALARCLYQE